MYFGNHNSHADFILIWAVLPRHMRRSARAVAAADYWEATKLRRFIGHDVLDAVLIDRNPETRTQDPIAQMTAAIDAGASLILFPEGRRNDTESMLLPFKSGLFHLARMRPAIDLVPVWIENLNRVLPRGELVPVPLICTVTFGEPLHLESGEEKDAFLRRAAAALLDLAPRRERAVE